MSKNLYKYIGPNYIDRIFTEDDFITLKCSYPKDFNDPYELFLTIDFNEEPEILAFYADAIGEIPQLPTACFSLSPIVIPMWAHYAQNLKGFCIEINEELLSDSFPQSRFSNVEYRNEPKEAIKLTLHTAFVRLKPRHLFFLINDIFKAAYYTKAELWSYEQERRMIVGEKEIRKKDDLLFMDVPKNCITGLICGPSASEEIVLTLKKEADQIGCSFYRLKIGKTLIEPFFIGSEGTPFIFKENKIESTDFYCGNCGEPLHAEENECSWCRIRESHKQIAARSNPFRMLNHYGLLESYLKDVGSFGKTD